MAFFEHGDLLWCGVVGLTVSSHARQPRVAKVKPLNGSTGEALVFS